MANLRLARYLNVSKGLFPGLQHQYKLDCARLDPIALIETEPAHAELVEARIKRGACFDKLSMSGSVQMHLTLAAGAALDAITPLQTAAE